MPIQSISSWGEHFLDGRKYLDTAVKGLNRPSVFNNELIFQLAAMAIEKMIIGLYHYHRQMPFDHTLSGLVEGLASVCPLESGLAQKIKHIEQIDNMCTLAPVRRTEPNDGDIQLVLDVGREVAGFTKRHIPLEDLSKNGLEMKRPPPEEGTRENFECYLHPKP